MNDGSLYTGVDNDPIDDKGLFGNEVIDEKSKQLIQEQEHKIKELTPQLESVLEMIDGEKQIALDFVADLIDNNTDLNTDTLAEIKAANRYRKYLDGLKTNFALALQETKR